MLRSLLIAALAFAAIPLPGLVGTAAAQFTGEMTVVIRPQDSWPPAPVADLTATAGAEGQLLLTWTAPDQNDDLFALKSAAAGYQIRIATYSVASIGGSTRTWWDSALDTRLIPGPPGAPGYPPAPAAPGTLQSLLLNGLEPGVTFWAMIVSSDAAGNFSQGDTRSQGVLQAGAEVFDATPPSPTSLAGFGVAASFQLSWTTAAGVTDLDHYNVYLDSTVPRDFVGAAAVPVSSQAVSAVLAGLPAGVYAIQVTAVDKGAPGNGGLMLESPAVSSLTLTLQTVVQAAQEPFGIRISTSVLGVTLDWMPVRRFEDGTPFANPLAPMPEELSEYHVYRSTGLALGAWTDVVAVSTDTLSWTDPAGTAADYYVVRSSNVMGLSTRSIARGGPAGSAYALAPDDQSWLEITRADAGSIEGTGGDPDTAYLVQATTRAETGDRILKSLEVRARRGGFIPEPGWRAANMAWLRLHYATVTTAGGVFTTPEAVPNTPENVSVYWYNGNRWMQLYGKLDASSQSMLLQTQFMGRYQLRTVERAGEFVFNEAGVSNRVVTPNGDGKNDDVVFTFDNPRDSEVTIKISDRRGRTVAGDLPAGPIAGTKVWRPAPSLPSGVYIYQVRSESRVYSGTIVIVK